MTMYDDPNRESVGLEPIWTGAGAEVNPPPEGDDDTSSARFDPGEHTVAEVEEYVDEHPDEREAVLEAELAGKGRVTLIEVLAE